jgi:hypothetical protein
LEGIFPINNWSESLPGCLAKLEFIFFPIKLFYVTALGLLGHKCKVKTQQIIGLRAFQGNY